MRNKIYPSEYLAYLTIKYEVDPDKFFNALVSAVKNKKSECGSLSIELRSRQNKKLSILITQDSKIVAQFHIPEEFIMRQSNPITAVRTAFLVERRHNKQVRPLDVLQIKDLRVGMKKVSLKATILEVSKPTFVVTRFGNYASVANAMVSDETGQIKLCLWNDQIKSVAVGDKVQIENARVSAFRNERQMRVGKRGTLRIEEGPRAIGPLS
jgi:replication factor A1